MKIGSCEVWALREGSFLLDGGSMFGIVPKPLWSRRHPADERNRIVMALRPLLIRQAERVILIDCGIGERFDARQQELYHYTKNGPGLVGLLQGLKIAPTDVTDIVATHLHFDHMAGLLSQDAYGTLGPVFPKATVHLQRAAWDWACSPSGWDRGSFFHQDFPVWRERYKLSICEGESELFPNVRVIPAGGHTPGHQVVLVGQGKNALLYCADLLPTASHIRPPFIMAYDQEPLVTLKAKRELLERALLEDWILAFEHDPFLAACRLKSEKGIPAMGEPVCLNQG